MAKTAQELGIKAPAGGFQDNGWYDGYNYDAASGTFADKRGQVWSVNNPAARGSMVSDEVNRQSAAAQGKSFQEFDTYLKGSNSTLAANAARNAGTSAGSGSGSGTSLSGGGSSAKFNVQDEYDRLYKELGIDDLKANAKAKMDEINARKARVTEATATINENPFYAETTRTGKERRLNEQANDEIANLIDEYNAIQGQVNEANQQLQVKTGLGVQQYQIDRQAAADATAELNTLLQAGADMSGINVGDFAARTGMSPDTISALVAASQAKEIKPTVIQSTNDAGVVTVTIIDQNTGAIVGQQNLGAIGNKQGGGAAKATEAEVARYYQENLRQDVAQGLGVREIFRLYSGYIDPNQIINIYNANSPHGVAKESPEELANYGVKY